MTPVDDNENLQIGPDPDKLFVYHRQQLSAMLDGELSPDQAKFMLRRLQHDSELASCWERWQVCGDVLRGQRNDLLPADFARRVALAMARDDGAVAEVPVVVAGSRPRLVRWGGGAAIAASVALLAVFVGRQVPEPGLSPDDAVPAPPLVAEASAPAPARVLVPLGIDTSIPADANADAGAPERAGQDASAALAVAAAAASQVPRRAGEQRVRRTPSGATRRSPATQDTAVVSVAAAAVEPPAIELPGQAPQLASAALPASGDHFAMPQAAQARPWPRSLLPSDSAFTVAEGRLAPREPGFEPFLPNPWQVPAAEPVPAGAVPP